MSKGKVISRDRMMAHDGKIVRADGYGSSLKESLDRIKARPAPPAPMVRVESATKPPADGKSSK